MRGESMKNIVHSIKSFVSSIFSMIGQHSNIILAVATIILAFATIRLYEVTNLYTVQSERLANITESDFELSSRPALSMKEYSLGILGFSLDDNCFVVQLSIGLENVGSVPLGFNVTANNSANAVLPDGRVTTTGILFPSEKTTIFFPPSCLNISNNTDMPLSNWDKGLFIDIRTDYNRLNDTYHFYRRATVQFFPITYGDGGVSFRYYLDNEEAN